MVNMLTCSTCAHWRADPDAYVGDCGMQVVYHRPPFDYAPPGGCRYHSELGKVSEAIAQQSAVRGDIVQACRQRMGIK